MLLDRGIEHVEVRKLPQNQVIVVVNFSILGKMSLAIGRFFSRKALVCPVTHHFVGDIPTRIVFSKMVLS